MPEVSVIIPNYNHCKYLRQRIDSVLGQTFQDIEVIILDDCSTDGSREIIDFYKNHPKISSIAYNERNSGSPFLQWKKGLEMSNGNWIWLAESDDYAEPNFLKEMLTRVAQYPNIGVSFCNSNWLTKSGEIGKSLAVYQTSFFRKGTEEIPSLLKGNTIQNASSAIIRKDAAKLGIHGIEQFRWCGDWYFYINILRDFNLCYSGKILNNFRYYDNGATEKAGQLDLWTIEGVKILTSLKRDKLNIPRTVMNGIVDHWLRRISRAGEIGWWRKKLFYFQLLRFYFRFL